MRTLTRRAAATVVAIALLLWGADNIDRAGVLQWLGYAALALGALVAYYALTGRTLLPGRDEGE
ncbi:MAG: hypothetical protein IT347_11355 [Candidatus Eisenbacteria bacterium]|nr:hypothetical protein [Candidatus Eisenbacteria bacterium]